MTWSPNREALRGRVAVEAGATVVCTGRSPGSARSEYNRAETIEETAELVTRLGGAGIAASVDHLESGPVKNLAEQIRKDYRHIGVLVNDTPGASS